MVKFTWRFSHGAPVSMILQTGIQRIDIQGWFGLATLDLNKNILCFIVEPVKSVYRRTKCELWTGDYISTYYITGIQVIMRVVCLRFFASA